MAKRTGPNNVYLRQLIEGLERKSRELNAPIWKDVAEKLERSTRRRVELNISRINRYANENETVLVPGVVISSGELTKKVNVAAWKFSAAAKGKIEKSKGKTLTIEELMKENPKGSGIRIMV